MNEVQVNSQGNVQSVDFTSQEPMQPQRSSQTEMMVTRQAQEVQVAMLAAKKFPRDQVVAYKPFATYQLSNNNAEIHRIEGRLKKLRAAKTEGNTESENTYFRTVENAEIMRLQLFFDDKPESNVRDVLKKNGFRWSRKNNCWQRQLTDNARYSLERVEKELEELATCLCNTCTFVSSDNEEPYL